MAKNYEKLFEELMGYTDFTDTDQINDNNLEDFFSQLADKSNTEKQKNQFLEDGSKTRQALLSGWASIKAKGEKRENERRKKGIESSRVYVGKGAFETAKKEQKTFYAGNKEVYKSVIIVYRDKNGKIIKDKKLKADIEAKRYKQPNKFKVVKK